jgi:hypothetical protein
MATLDIAPDSCSCWLCGTRDQLQVMAVGGRLYFRESGRRKERLTQFLSHTLCGDAQLSQYLGSGTALLVE